MIRPTLAPRRRRPGFTLIELLVVIAIIGVLVGLLVPAVYRAIRTAKEAAVMAEINLMAQSLASFNARSQTLPPSRIILMENGNYDTSLGTALAAIPWEPPNPLFAQSSPPIGGTPPPGNNPPFFSPTDLTYGQLAQRSVTFLRKIYPRAIFSTTGPVFPANGSQGWYDFNGDGIMQQQPYLLQGHEAIVFFLGGMPSHSGPAVAMSGLGKDPRNPFRPVPAGTVSANREEPLFAFKADRLVDDDGDGIPGYIDSLGTQSEGRYFAYFSSYGGGSYDPNDVNLATIDEPLVRPFRVNFAVPGPTNLIASLLPNPYTTDAPVPATNNPASFINPDAYQIISAGSDRIYGIGGPYTPSGTEKLPIDTSIPGGDRKAEQDNLTNFASSRLD